LRTGRGSAMSILVVTSRQPGIIRSLATEGQYNKVEQPSANVLEDSVQLIVAVITDLQLAPTGLARPDQDAGAQLVG